MQSGYFQPLTSSFRLLWMWWVIVLSFQQVIFYENNLKLYWYSITMIVFLVLSFYFLVRQRRFFVEGNHIYFTRDFRLQTLNIDLDYIDSVKLGKYTLSFIYVGREYHYFIFGQSNLLLRQLFESHLKQKTKEQSTRD